ncbi:glycoside hydrolase family 88 protein [Halosquirtibacter xylanolyticus]|uniref:glycoside hydrolase family 88 protein n=1 Tax=Halosquirtibacter xylanolyticus TaxID=3374599 RepID=UPI003747F8F8|nr:glycoside hydrolase family 88 protein [Prolixibacteraceae bacterium]
MIKKGILSLIIGCTLLSCSNNELKKDNIKSTFDKTPKWVSKSFNTINGHAKNMLSEVLKFKQTPRSTERGLKPSRDWTSGFYPGTLWYLYEYSRNDQWQKDAQKVTQLLEKEQYNTEDHDVGFRIYCSYGNGWLLTKNNSYKKVVIQAAKSLATRFNEKTKTIQSWNANEKRDWKFPVIIDNMMNLELIYEAYKLSGDKNLKRVALTHADQTMKYHYRKDFSCPHVIDYDPETGEFRKMDWNNGFCDPNTAAWSRGQSWGLYGYTMMYRETKDPKYLKFAENIANFITDHPKMPKDFVPYWDYSCPKPKSMRDASAAAIMASALLELSEYSEQYGQKYFNIAEIALKSLSSIEYLAPVGTNENFIIKHTTGNYLAGSEVNGSLSYGDYYYTEGLIRYLKIINNQKLY